jgi:hypothetical protein
MSQENVEVVRRIYRDVSAHVWAAPAELFDPEYEVDLTDAGPDLGVIHGLDAAEAALRGYTETFEDFRIELTEVVHADEECVIRLFAMAGDRSAANPRSGTASSTSGHSAAARSLAAPLISTRTGPSKPPGLRE